MDIYIRYVEDVRGYRVGETSPEQCGEAAEAIIRQIVRAGGVTGPEIDTKYADDAMWQIVYDDTGCFVEIVVGKP